MLNIVTSSLQLYLIASNTSSYAGSGNTWTDLSPNAYNATIVGAPSFNGICFNFDGGSTQYVDTNQSLSSNLFSVGAWFRTSADGIKMILSTETVAGSPWNYRVWMNGGLIVADISQGVDQKSLTSPLVTYNDGNWHYVMFTRDDSDWYLYMDGVQINTMSDPYTGDITNSQELWIGRSAFPAGYQYVGDIGEVFIYNTALSSGEILTNFNATKETYYPVTPTPTPTPTSTATPTPTPTNTPSVTPTITATVTPTFTQTPTPSYTPTNTPTVTPTPTSTPYPQICVQPLLAGNSTYFPLWKNSTFKINGVDAESISPCGTQIYEGAIVQLQASQVYYSLDYYAIYPPHTIYSAGAFWYTTVKGFTASYDPNTVVRIGATVNVTGSKSGIQAIYR